MRRVWDSNPHYAINVILIFKISSSCSQILSKKRLQR
nr:MAG TPA: hypothetical protein [Caudoviricetes sp.]